MINNNEQKTHKTSVGGQALIEGVMMQGPRGMATAVRKPDGEILTEYHTIKLLRNKINFQYTHNPRYFRFCGINDNGI